MNVALSDAEFGHQGIFQELSEVKQQRDTLDQKYLSLLALCENLKSKPPCALDDVIQVKHEASRWKENLKGEIEAQSTGEKNLCIIDQPSHHCMVLPFVVLSFSSVT